MSQVSAIESQIQIQVQYRIRLNQEISGLESDVQIVHRVGGDIKTAKGKHYEAKEQLRKSFAGERAEGVQTSLQLISDDIVMSIELLSEEETRLNQLIRRKKQELYQVENRLSELRRDLKHALEKE